MRYADPADEVSRQSRAGVENVLDAGPAVVVAVLTYLRPTDLLRCLTGALREIDAQGPGSRVSVMVVDNDPAGSARPVITGLADARVFYVVEPTPGISAGRNRALRESSEADVLIFIDDDEVPNVGWLERMLGTWQSSGAQAVAGRVVSEFDGPLDPWVRASRLFDRPERVSGTLMSAAATNNLLLDLRAVREFGLSFDEEFGLSGGSDTLFTRSLIRAGGVIVWDAEAVVVDHVPTERITRDWVLARSRRMANTEIRVGLVLAETASARSGQRLRSAVRGLSRIVLGGGRSLFGLMSGSLGHRARGRRIAARGVGMCTAAMGLVIQEYRRTPRACLRTAPDTAETTVLASFPEPRSTTNPYIAMLARAVDEIPGVTLWRFGWRQALFGRYQVFHVHWPETLLGSGHGVKKVVREVLFGLLIARLRFGKVAVVRTVHNIRPHESRTGISARLLSVLDGLITVRIGLNDIGDDAAHTPIVPIVHGHYRDWFSTIPVPESVPGVVLMPGLIRRYKDPIGLVDAFAGVGEPGDHHRLRLVGRVEDEELASLIRASATGDARVTVVPEYVSDERMATEMGAAELVVLPYREMFNSGISLLALSLDRPVLIPDNPINRALSIEVSPGWVHLYEGTLTDKHLISALDAIRTPGRTEHPDLSRRNWDVVGRAHLAAYRLATEMMQNSQRGSG